jgi:urease accessory protein
MNGREQVLGSPDPSSRLRLLQVTSQALPTGAFAYSGGLESALELGMLKGAEECGSFLAGWMRAALGCVELPYFLRMRASFLHGDVDGAQGWSRRLLASRESAEAQAQDRQMAHSLQKVLAQLLGDEIPDNWTPVTYAEGLALAGVKFSLSEEDAVSGCAFGWLEQHVSALTRLVPLGPLAGQRLVDRGVRELPTVIQLSRALSDDELGAGCPAMAMAGARHETQYSRMFRS